jgi:hypothetical protein
MSQTNTSVATTILQQLGGGRFVAMTGAKHILADKNALVFQLPRRFAKDGINAVKITLEPSDTYTVEFKKIGDRRTAYKCTVVSSFENVYSDQLQSIFQSATGLSTRLF